MAGANNKMANLQNILYKVHLQAINGSTNMKVKDIQIDSRNISPNSLFVAIRGTVSDGHTFIDAAIEKGATVIVCEEMPLMQLENVTYLKVNNTSEAAAYMAHNFYGEPSTKMKLVGVTGTNGKTTIATLLFKLFSSLGYACGLLSTVQNQVGATFCPLPAPRPMPFRSMRYLNKWPTVDARMYL